MNLKKTVLIASAAGALAAISVPAMALENEFHGIYNLRFIGSNVENGGTAAIDPTAYKANNSANNFFEQRARLQYTAKANDDLKLVTHFELDTKFGGDKTGKYGVSSDAGVLDADGISLETKHVYLDFNLGKSVNVRAGVQPIKDSLKGILIDADIAGITVTTKMSPLTLGVGYYRMATESSNSIVQPATTSYFAANNALGHDNYDFFVLDGKLALGSNLNVGASYYLLSNYTGATSITDHTLGVNADAKIGSATISGFVAAQNGYSGTKRTLAGLAANVAAKVAVGPGTLKAAGLYTSGDGDISATNTRDTQWFNTGFTTYTEGGMMLLVRTGVGGTTNDRNIIHSAGAGQKGLYLATMGYDAAITPKYFFNANLGAAFAADGQASKNTSGHDMNVLGVEVNAETGYKVYDNLTAKVQVAYVVLGSYYYHTAAGATGNTPENPYAGRVVLNYAF
jgi:hypothetical protein